MSTRSIRRIRTARLAAEDRHAGQLCQYTAIMAVQENRQGPAGPTGDQPGAVYAVPQGSGQELAELIGKTVLLLDELAAALPAEQAAHARTRDRYARLRSDYARLLSAARATVAADQDREPDPMLYLRGLLAHTGQMPAPGMHAPGLLAAARESLTVTAPAVRS